tara:strand:- start:91 stop:678 length:588 start_codon:yes stop_codon:yes gene_type:complete
MQLIKHKQTHESNNFILGWYVDPKVCDRIIDHFETSAKQRPGHISSGEDHDVKRSTDATFVEKLDKDLFRDYSNNLQQVFEEYIKVYPMVDFYSAWGVIEGINIQRYLPTEGFYKWHTERGSADLKIQDRHMVFMTYLNDVVDGGETEFFHQNIKVKAQKGLTIMWPADWTFTHRGCTSNTETKYIVTGWTSYYD